MRHRDLAFDRAFGALIGLAIGDSMGVSKQYVNRVIKESLHALRRGLGQ